MKRYAVSNAGDSDEIVRARMPYGMLRAAVEAANELVGRGRAIEIADLKTGARVRLAPATVVEVRHALRARSK